MTNDQCCTIVPYFLIHEGKEEIFKGLCEEFVEKTSGEPKCLYYGFSFLGNRAHCREGYEDAQGVLHHLENVDALLKQALEVAELEKLEIHGPETELEKLRGPLSALNPDFFVLEYGFRKG